MRFAIAATDRYLGVFETFVHAGWVPVKLFTSPMRSELGNQQAVIAYAARQDAAIQLSRMTEDDLETLRKQGCEALIVATYDWKIPDWRPYLKYAVNFHASPLPDGRGPYPVVRAILENRSSWAITCHKLSEKIDGGDILAAERIPMQPDECHERLDLKIQVAARRLAAKTALQFAELWQKATPQPEGHYWKKLRIIDRVIDFTQSVDHILRHIGAFGATESLANINGVWLIVKRAVGWAEMNLHPPGTVVHVYNRSIVIAASDGYIGLLESDLAQPQVLEEIRAAQKDAAE